MSKTKNISVIVLAGGKGERMGLGYSKVLKNINGKPLIFWTLDLINKLGFQNTIVVTGYKAPMVEEKIKKNDYNVIFSRQKEQWGTADAVKYGLRKVPKEVKTALVLFGDDSALYSSATIKRFIKFFYTKDKPVSVIATEKKQVSQIGGLKIDEQNNIRDILTRADILKINKERHLVLCGAFCFKKDWLTKNIKKIKRTKRSKEYSLPKVLILAAKQKKYAQFYLLKDKNQWNSLNTLEEFRQAELKMSNVKVL